MAHCLTACIALPYNSSRWHASGKQAVTKWMEEAVSEPFGSQEGVLMFAKHLAAGTCAHESGQVVLRNECGDHFTGA